MFKISKDYPGILGPKVQDINKFREDNLEPNARIAIVIDGPTLAYVFEDQ